MINIKEYEGHALNNLGRFVATIDLKSTVVAKYAPFGAGGGEPHVVGYGNTPASALDNAYRALGQHLVQTKSESESSAP